ncbi:MAG: peptidylprolyl isomerase [Bacteroidia bacterium]
MDLVLRSLLFSTCLLFLGLSACEKADNAKDLSGEADVIMKTSLGDVGIVLYDATPIHRDNFLKLAKSGFYDSLYFHRIMLGFMVQTGDPGTRNGDFSQDNGPGYDLASEFSEERIHTRAKLGAARESDEQNPEKRSAGSQFYIVTGKAVSNALLDSVAQERTKVLRGDMYDAYQLLPAAERESLSFQAFLEREDFRPFDYTQEQRDAYLDQGGTPHLDFTYTVFGEVIYGMEIVRKIEVSQVDKYTHHPLQAVRILSMQVVADSSAAANN